MHSQQISSHSSIFESWKDCTVIRRLSPVLNAFLTVIADEALAEAREAEAEVRRGKWRGPLHGIPIGLKDNIDTAGVRTTLASAVFKDRVPSADAEVVRRLKAAGAVLLGKQNLHEVAFGTTAAISHFGPVHNPWQHDRIAGGSSGGSAAAVAAGLCFGAVGTDAGGSIRVPASYCGIVGLKPTYGLVGMRGGGEAGWWSMNHLGPMCRSVADAALLLSAIAGYDPRDSTSVGAPIPNYTAALRARLSTLRLGVPRAIFFEKLDPEIEAAMNTALGLLRRLTGGFREVSLQHATPHRSILTVFRPFQSRADSPAPGCLLAFRSAGHPSAKRRCWRSRTRTSKRRTGTGGGHRCSSCSWLPQRIQPVDIDLGRTQDLPESGVGSSQLRLADVIRVQRISLDS